MNDELSGIQNFLSITVCKDAAEAIAEGYNYRRPEVLPIRVQKIVVVQRGTMEGNATVDFLLQNETGQRYVFMVTASLLRSIPV